MKTLIKLIITIFLFQTSLLANYQSIYIPDNLKKDLSEGKVAKYQVETIPVATLEDLKRKAVLGASETLTRSISGTPTFDVIMNADICRVSTPEAFTSTIYEMDLPSGIITCMYGAKGDLYNPMGLFKINVPEIKAYYTINSEAAKTANAAAIAQAEAQFAPLLARKQEIISEMSPADGYLTIPEILMAAVLTDDEIIDIPATKSTGKFQLKEGYTSKFTNSTEVVDNSEYLLTDAAAIFEVYTGLSGISMQFLLILSVGFGVFGATKFFGNKAANKLEKKNGLESDTSYIVGLALGVLLFFPANTSDSTEYEKLNNHYQDWEKFGYYTFSDWAKAATKVVIDSEIDVAIRRSGLGTKEQIVSTAAQATQAEKLQAFYTDNYSTCANDIYKSDYLFHSDNKTIFGESHKSMFPSTEHWAYVAFAAKSLADGYYEKGAGGVLQDGAAADGRYPKFAFSSCGKAERLSTFYQDRKTALNASFGSLIATQGSSQNTAKMNVLGNIFEFQYKLYRDYGYLAVLGLPIVKMQAQQISGGGANSSVLEKINKEGANTDKVLHSILSSIPYMLVPGAGTIFELVKSNAIVIGAASGAVGFASTAPGDGVVHSILSVVGGWFGGFGGAAVGYTDAGAGLIGAAFAYKAAKILLMLLPIVGLVLVGILRFTIIAIKMFAFHFLSLFIMPVMFVQKNLESMAKFTAKILATMLEIPIFVLAVWLAMQANSIVSTIGNILRNSILDGMFGADLAGAEELKLAGYDLGDAFSTMLIYIFDGVMELGTTVFAIVIMYKIVISAHNMLLDAVDLKVDSAIDNSIDAMRNEGSSWGARI
jgi:hypothetical protein